MASGAARRDVKKEAIWRRHVMGQVASGLSIGAYCRRHGLPGHGFYWWRRELVRRDAQNPPAFVPVTVAMPEAREQVSAIEIVLPCQRQVRVMGAVDRQMLRDVLSVLEEPEGRREGQRC
jgi:transposase